MVGGKRCARVAASGGCHSASSKGSLGSSAGLAARPLRLGSWCQAGAVAAASVPAGPAAASSAAAASAAAASAAAASAATSAAADPLACCCCCCCCCCCAASPGSRLGEPLASLRGGSRLQPDRWPGRGETSCHKGEGGTSRAVSGCCSFPSASGLRGHTARERGDPRGDPCTTSPTVGVVARRRARCLHGRAGGAVWGLRHTAEPTALDALLCSQQRAPT